MLPQSGNDSAMSTAAPPISNMSAPPTISQISKRTRKPQSTTTSTSLSSLFMTSTITTVQHREYGRIGGEPQVSQHPHGRPSHIRQMEDIPQHQRPSTRDHVHTTTLCRSQSQRRKN